MGIYEELQARGLLAQVTDENEIRTMINAGKATFYIGFDCTADSLTAGHFMALTLMKRLQEAGNRPIALIGGGTTMIGDPSGRTDMRKMLTKEDIDHNAACFKRQMERFIEFGEGKAQMLNNADWLLNLNYGGNDQWSNMLGGTELIRRKLGKDAHAMTITLLTDSQGKKMRKTAGNAVWLDPNKTSPYDFFQYWRNVDDADVMKCIRMLTFLPLDQIDDMDHWEGSKLNEAKEILAYELTKMVHGEDEAEKAKQASHALFTGGADDSNMPTTALGEAQLTDGKIGVLELLTACGLAASKSEARRLVQQGGVFVNGEKVPAIDVTFTADQLRAGLKIRKGKKVFHKATLA